MVKKGIERGQTITFRVPSDTPDYLLKKLSQLKETERRNFSSTIASFVLKGVNESFAKEREAVTIPLPKKLTKEQRSWLKHEHSEAMIGTILYHLLSDPMRATSLLSSLNSNRADVNDIFEEEEKLIEGLQDVIEQKDTQTIVEDPLEDVDLNMLEIHDEVKEKVQIEKENPLEDFFASMNK